MELSHKDILQADVTLLAGLMILLSFIFSFLRVDGGSDIRLWVDLGTKLAIGLSSLFFVLSAISIIDGNLKKDPSKEDLQKTTETALREIRHGLVFLFLSSMTFIILHEIMIIFEI